MVYRCTLWLTQPLVKYFILLLIKRHNLWEKDSLVSYEQCISVQQTKDINNQKQQQENKHCDGILREQF